MFKVVKKVQLAPETFSLDILAPRVAKSALPGQFVILIADKYAERVPLTISDYNLEEGTVQVVIQAIGPSTQKLAKVEEGEEIESFVGPLGRPSDFTSEDPASLKEKKVLFVGGGLGAAPVYPQAKWFHNHDYSCDVIIGGKSKDYIILEDKMREVADQVYPCTDDGSYGFHGMVTDCLKDLVQKGNHYDHVVAIGPMIMMKFVCLLTKELNIPTTVSLNPIMVDGTGMCGACRCTVGGKTRFACVHGPEFDGHQVDFDEAMKRQRQYADVEKGKGCALGKEASRD